MTLDDSLSERLHDLLEQTRHELRTCKKSLAFKESLLTDLELENAELAENNEKLDRELQCLKRQELRRSEFDRANDDCVDDGYGQWSHDEDDFPLYAATEIEKPKQSEHGRCSTCETLDLERSELFERIEELQEQLELARKVNKVLQEDVNQKTAQIADLTEALLQKQAREERLEADLQFTAAEREIALRDLQDSQMSLFSSRRSSEEYFRSSSIGSSLAEELGLDRNDILTGDKRFPPSFVDWDEILAEPEAGPLAEFESISAKSSRETSVELDLPSLGTQKAELTDESESSQDDSPEDGNLIEENEPQMERATPPSQIHQDEWKNLQYSALQSVCPTLSGPFRRRAQECKTKNNLLRCRDQRTGNAQDEVDMRRCLPTNDSSLLRTHQDEQLD